MYEGILVDVPFAGFFLLKWALTGTCFRTPNCPIRYYSFRLAWHILRVICRRNIVLKFLACPRMDILTSKSSIGGTGAASRESSYRANLNDLRDLDEGLYQGLLQLKNYTGNVEDFSLNFTIEDAIEQRRRDKKATANNRTVTRELRRGGSSMPVTNENRLIYISLVARHRLQIQPKEQTWAFLRGLGQIVSPSWLSMFNQSELQTLISGSRGEIDVSDLRRNTLYGGVYAIGDDGQEHPTVQLFWKGTCLFGAPVARFVFFSGCKTCLTTQCLPEIGKTDLGIMNSLRADVG